jgi:hypothetical protein
MVELAAGRHAATEAEERARRQDRLQRAEAAFDPLPFDADAARAFGRLYAAVVASGRKARGAGAVDLLIAATRPLRACRSTPATATTCAPWRNSLRWSFSNWLGQGRSRDGSPGPRPLTAFLVDQLDTTPVADPLPAGAGSHPARWRSRSRQT